MLKMKYTEIVSNEKVLEHIGEESFWASLPSRRIQLVGKILRHTSLVKLVMEYTIPNKQKTWMAAITVISVGNAVT